MARRRRLDVEMVRRGLVPSRARANAAIEEGQVLVSGAMAHKPSRLVTPGEPIELRRPAPFVSRGGEKLAGALARFAVDPAGKRCLDAGASTGGFTDCLLQAGAAELIAVDVGRGQLDARLRADPRVRVIEGRNVRALTPADIGIPVDLVTADLSFISLTIVAPALVAVARPEADFVLLVKPQFEAGRSEVGKKGVIRDASVHRRVLGSVIEALTGAGLAAQRVAPSTLPGATGNLEFFAHLRVGERSRVGAAELDAAVAEAHGQPRHPAGPAGC